MRSRKEDLSPHVKWVVAAMLTLTLLILAYQQTHRADFTAPALRARVPVPPESTGPAPAGTIKVGPERDGAPPPQGILNREKP
jgi:hypothetical protein